MTFTYYGHSCFLVEFGGKKLLFDPFIRANQKAAHIDVELIEADYILLSHGHIDHVADAEHIARRTGAPIISNFEIVSWYKSKGLTGHEMNHGGSWKFNFGTVKYVAAVHSSVLPDGAYGGNPGGFVVYNNDHCFYFAGDTALTFDMKLIPLTCPRLDIALLPIGNNFTMDYRDAALALDFVNCPMALGCHYDTFGFLEIDHKAAIQHFEAAGKELILLPIGDRYSI
jgi:L-ascorbate metabolism protein UlaG (beta-lactamase superfamily)